jgi:hypothetical protein
VRIGNGQPHEGLPEWIDVFLFLRQPIFTPLENSDMQKVNPFSLYTLGGHLGKLASIVPGDLPGDRLQDIIFAQAALDLVIHSSAMAPIQPLTSCVMAAKRLQDRLGQLAKLNPNQPLFKPEVEQLHSLRQRFEGSLQTELAGSPTFFVPPRGIYDTTALIERAETVFSPAILERLSAEAIADLRQAGRALAFDLPTASGFHGCRAVEAVIKKQVLLFSGSPAPDTNWGDYVRILKLHGADGRVADSIHRLKETHRNPLIHPEVTLTMSEAIALLPICHSAIQACVADMERKAVVPSDEILQMLPPPEKPNGMPS